MMKMKTTVMMVKVTMARTVTTSTLVTKTMIMTNIMAMMMTTVASVGVWFRWKEDFT